MLVLSRKCNESIVIAGQVVIRVLSLSGNRVRLGVEAPRRVAVHRMEVAMRQRHVLDQQADHPLPLTVRHLGVSPKPREVSGQRKHLLALLLIQENMAIVLTSP